MIPISKNMLDLVCCLSVPLFIPESDLGTADFNKGQP